ncbi:hypothetical protein P4J22_19455 [Bacillus cereus]|nr:hypothetical protein [Bacillus cereus]
MSVKKLDKVSLFLRADVEENRKELEALQEKYQLIHRVKTIRGRQRWRFLCCTLHANICIINVECRM